MDKTALNEIVCPSCGEPIPVNETIYHQALEKAKADAKVETLEVQKKLAERENLIKEKESSIDKVIEERLKVEKPQMWEKAQEKAKELVAVQLEDLKKQAAEKDQRLAELQKTELDLLRQKRDLEEKEKGLELEMEKKFEAEKAKIKLEATKEAKSALSVELKDLRDQAIEKDKKLKEAQEAELELLKQKRNLEEREKNLELETARRLNEESSKIREETTKRLSEEHRLKDAEKDKKLQDVLRINDELKRKVEQGSQQTQGEVLELELEKMITASFPLDQMIPVPKGVNGADVIQRVVNRSGEPCGTIVWESKHTKNWVDGWIQKIKDDQRLVKAEIAIIVTEVLPKGVDYFGNVRGVWVTCPQCAFGLANVLRTQLLEITNTKLSVVGKNEKMEVLFNYLTGPEFRQRVEAILEPFIEMQKDLETEKRTTQLRWSKREKQLDRVVSNTSGMYGDFKGLIGSSLQTIPALASGEEEAVINEEEGINAEIES